MPFYTRKFRYLYFIKISCNSLRPKNGTGHIRDRWHASIKMKSFRLFPLLVILACKNPADLKHSSEDSSSSQKKTLEKSIEFNLAQEFRFKNPDRAFEDTLVLSTSYGNLEISPTGLLKIGDKAAIQLNTELIVDKAYIHKDSSNYYLFFTDTDHEGATSWIQKINRKSNKSGYTKQIQGFNLGQPIIKDGKAYVTAIGFIGKIDMLSGNYDWKHYDLYDRTKYSFNSFDSISFSKGSVEFTSENYHSKKTDRIVVDDMTGKIELIDK